MIVDQLCSVESHRHLFDVVWAVLDAANDLRDTAAVEACRRVIDASLCGIVPAPADINVVFDFFR